MSETKIYYISTAIAYTSAKPHIGNTYEIVLADAIARYKRMTGYRVYFQTGTDEHGQKIQEKAEAAGVTPQEYVDGVAGEIRRIWDLMNTTYDKFVRTSDPEHVAKVQKSLSGSMIRGIFTRAPTTVNIAPPVRAFGPKASLRMGNARIVDGKFRMRKKKHTFSA